MTTTQLQRVARAQGIQTSYVNAAGKKVIASRNTLEAILHAIAARDDTHPQNAVVVLWDGKPKRVPLRGVAQLRLETGEVVPVKDSTLPRCPFGYHTLETKDGESLVISAPSKSYSDPAIDRAWGVFAPTYALRGRTEGFSEWRNLIDWLHPLGATVVGTLPLLASFPSEPSPYSPASRLS